jgi:UDP-GlcNAc:undecaprenyl-phosphate GlcNAc-1-phosphate transferase
MILMLTLVLGSFALSFLITPICRDLAIRYRLLDRPDYGRKVHRRPIPRIGGIPIVLPCLLSVLILNPRLLAPVLLIFAAGLWDDLFGLAARSKFLTQVCAAALACGAGLSTGEQNWWSVPLTVLWLVGCTNAFNLIDGLDGLADGLGLIAAVTTAAAGLLTGHYVLALAAAPLAGALCGFLPYNFSPASIFLGDSGSLSLGFLFGIYGVHWFNKAESLPAAIAPVVALSIPLLDTVLAIARRFAAGRPIFSADRRHIHHLLLDSGLSSSRVALVLYGACALAAGVSLLLTMAPAGYAGLIVAAFCAAAWTGIRRLGYAEFADLPARLRFRTTVPAVPSPVPARCTTSSASLS